MVLEVKFAEDVWLGIRTGVGLAEGREGMLGVGATIRVGFHGSLSFVDAGFLSIFAVANGGS